MFLSNFDGTDLIPITNGLLGFNRVEDISPDGTKILISTFNSDPDLRTLGDLFLFSIDGTEIKMVSNRYSREWGLNVRRSSCGGAKFLSDHEIVYTSYVGGNWGIFKENILEYSVEAIKRFEPHEFQTRYLCIHNWKSHRILTWLNGTSNKVSGSGRIDVDDLSTFEELSGQFISSTGEFSVIQTRNYLEFVKDPGGLNEPYGKIEWESRFRTLDWSPDGKYLFIFSSGGPKGSGTYVWSTIDRYLEKLTGFFQCHRIAWSPDSRIVLCEDFNENGISYVIDIETGSKYPPLASPQTSMAERAKNIYWLPTNVETTYPNYDTSTP